jgi:hypothetical protein
MGPESIHIEELRLRVPGLSEAEARRLGEEVTRRVAEALPEEGRAEKLRLVDVRLSIPQGVPKEELARRIAEGILRNLQ